MKRIFNQDPAPKRFHRGAKLVFTLIGGVAALGFATVGGAVSSAPGSQQLQPDSQFPVMAFDLTPDDRAIAQFEIAGETVFPEMQPIQALAKADRMPLPFKLALAGSAASARDMSSPLDMRMPHPIAYSVVTEPGYENETFVTHGLAYASLDMHDDSTPFGRATGIEPAGVMPTQPAETPDIAEEEDDAQPMTLAVPLPHAKPILDPSLPLPKMRPELPSVAAIPYPGRIPPSKPDCRSRRPTVSQIQAQSSSASNRSPRISWHS